MDKENSNLKVLIKLFANACRHDTVIPLPDKTGNIHLEYIDSAYTPLVNFCDSVGKLLFEENQSFRPVKGTHSTVEHPHV